MITTITGDNDDYAYKVLEECKKVGLRAAVDVRNEKINYKIREHSNAKIPVILVVGTKEQEKNGSGEALRWEIAGNTCA